MGKVYRREESGLEGLGAERADGKTAPPEILGFGPRRLNPEMCAGGQSYPFSTCLRAVESSETVARGWF
jgi:hypothetical protein